jgi:serine-type D-Ala-D-Ala carboxypeptidase/endopeptidase (penicillin-binding protein 4)
MPSITSLLTLSRGLNSWVSRCRTMLLVVSLLYVSGAQSQNQQLQDRLLTLADDPFFQYAHLGVAVRDVSTMEVIAGVQPYKKLIPASTVKLITTLSAIRLLGKDYTYKTHLKYDGTIVDGVLTGNIYLEGSGDPTLGSDRIPGVLPDKSLIAQIAEDIRSIGILSIDGQIISDESIYNSYPISPSWQWEDLGLYYATGAWGINYNENQYAIYFHRDGSVGSPTRISHWDPFIPQLEITNEVSIEAGDTEDRAYIFGGPYNYGKRIVGTIPQGKGLYRVKGALPDPPLFVAYSIAQQLAQNGIAVKGHKTQYYADASKSLRKPISTYTSPNLQTISKYANDRSINLYAESMLKTIGHTQRGRGAGSEGIAAIDILCRNMGIPTAAIHLEDGSGLSTRNLICPDAMTTFLGSIAQHLGIDQVTSLIPKAGEEGTVKALLSSSVAKGKVWAKSGSMDKILCYAGYIQTASGRYVAFTVMLNASIADSSRQNRAQLEKLIEAIYLFS